LATYPPNPLALIRREILEESQREAKPLSYIIDFPHSNGKPEGALAPTLEQQSGASKRGEAPLFIPSPFPLSRGRGIKGDGVNQ